MSEGQIKDSEVYQLNLYADLVKSGQLANSMLKQQKKLLVSIQKDFKGIGSNSAKDVHKLAEAEKKLKATTDAMVETKKAKKVIDTEALKIQKQLTASTDEEVKGKLRFQQAAKAQKDALRDLLVLENKEAGTLQKLTAKNNILRRERDKLNTTTEKGSTRLREINAQLDKNNVKIDNNSDKLKKQKRNVGNYSAGVSQAINSSGLFSRQLFILTQIKGTLSAFTQKNTADTATNTVATDASTTATTTAAVSTGILATVTAASTAVIGGMSKALKVLKYALIATGIGAIVLAIAGLVTMFTRSQAGADKFSQALAGVKAAIAVVLDRLILVGEAIIKVFSGDFAGAAETAKAAFSGIGEEIKKDAAAAALFEKNLQSLRRELSGFIVDNARLQRQIAENKLLSEDETKTIKQRIAALQEAFKIEEVIAKGFIREEIINKIQQGASDKDRLKAEQLLNSVLEGRRKFRVADLGIAESNIEDLEEINTLTASIIDAETEQFTKQKKERSKINSLREEGEADVNKLKADGKKLDDERSKRTADFEKQIKDRIVLLRVENKLTEIQVSKLEKLGEGLDSIFEAEQERKRTVANILVLEAEISLEKATQKGDVQAIAAAEQAVLDAKIKQIAVNLEADKGATQSGAKKKELELQAELEATSLKKTKSEESNALDERLENYKNFAAGVNSVLESIRDNESKLLQAQVVENNQALTTQERRSEQGLDNELAFRQQKAAELEIQQAELAEKQMQQAKAMNFLNSVAEYSKTNPNTAPAKAIAQAAVVESFVGFFNEGTESVGGDTHKKWRSTGTDDYIAAVNEGERILTTDQNNKIGGFSNDEVANLMFGIRTGQIPVGESSNFNDARIVSGLLSLGKTIRESKQELNINWTSHGEMIERRIKDSQVEVIKHVSKRTRL
jgi:hypothetical protein